MAGESRDLELSANDRERQVLSDFCNISLMVKFLQRWTSENVLRYRKYPPITYGP